MGKVAGREVVVMDNNGVGLLVIRVMLVGVAAHTDAYLFKCSMLFCFVLLYC